MTRSELKAKKRVADFPLLSVIINATKAVPFVKYALGLSGIIALIALVKAYGISPRIAFWGTVLTLCLMLILFLFAKLSLSKTKAIHGPAITLMWAIVIIFIATILCLFTSVFFQYPQNLCKWIDPNCGYANISNLTKNDTSTKKNDTVYLAGKIHQNKANKLSNTSKKENEILKSITLSIQLRKESDGYKGIFFNGKAINTLPQSTKYNPRIEILNYSGRGELLILTKNKDSCKISLPNKIDTTFLRIVPNCN
ncbi:MAG: hypothetical protein Q8941_21240 [Bacteroidota bacterium]|nr:hypothetical protein [Bacteroidota bacterium]